MSSSVYYRYTVVYKNERVENELYRLQKKKKKIGLRSDEDSDRNGDFSISLNPYKRWNEKLFARPFWAGSLVILNLLFLFFVRRHSNSDS